MEKNPDGTTFSDTIPALTCCINTDYSFRYLDPEWEKVLGYPLKDLLSRSLFNFIHPSDLEKTRNKLEKQLKAEHPVDCTGRYRCKDGAYREFEWRFTLPCNDTIFAVARHVPERTISEKALNDFEDRYRGLFNSIPDAILVANTDRTIIDCNNELMKLFGYSFDELKGKQTRILYNIDEEYNNISKSLEENFGSHFSHNNVSYKKKNGDVFLGKLSVFYHKNMKGEIIGSVGIIKDVSKIVKTEAALKEVEYKYHSLLDNMLDACALHEIICDENGKPVDYRILHINPAFKKMAIFRNNDIIGKTILEIMPASTSFWIETYGKVALTGEPITFNYIKKRTSQQYIVTAYRIKEMQVAAIFLDITELKNKEELLFVSEERFRQIFANIGFGIAIYEAADNGNDFIFKDINPFGARLAQKTREEHIGKSIFEIYPAVKEMGIFDTLKEVWETGHSKHFPVTNYHDNKIAIWVENYITKLPSGEVMAVYEDLTEKKIAEEAIIESEEKYRTVYNTAPLAFVLWDTQCRVIEWNYQAEKMFGYKRSEVLGENLFNLIMPEMAKEPVERVINNLRNGKIENHIINRTNTKNGDLVWCEWNNAILRNAEGKTTSVISLGLNITDRIKNEDELKKYRQHLEDLVKDRTAELEGKNRELETFTYSVSHDLKAPLRGIDGYSRLLTEEYSDKLDDEGHRFLNNIRHSTEQMHQLIEDLLTYSRMERKDLRLVEVDIRQLLDELVFEREQEISSGLVEVNIELRIKHIITDRDCMRQILGNLLDNAIKFSRENPAPRIDIEGKETPDAWAITVRDNGIGFDSKYRDRIFGIFQRLHRSEDYPGTGIGLALVQKAAQRMKGTIRAEGRVGKGAVFYLEIAKL